MHNLAGWVVGGTTSARGGGALARGRFARAFPIPERRRLRALRDARLALVGRPNMAAIVAQVTRLPIAEAAVLLEAWGGDVEAAIAGEEGAVVLRMYCTALMWVGAGSL